MNDHNPPDALPLLPPRLTRRTLLAASALAGVVAGVAPASPAQAVPSAPPDEDGYELWLRYRLVVDTARLAEYRSILQSVVVEGDHLVLGSAGEELTRGLSGLLGRPVPRQRTVRAHTVVVGTLTSSDQVSAAFTTEELTRLGEEGFIIRRLAEPTRVVIGSLGERGALYGVFRFLQHLQRQRTVTALDLSDHPRSPLRMLNHWDNLDGTVERGYAGRSIFRWGELPQLDQRYTDYARMLASVGINQTVVNNVNANPQFLSTAMLRKLMALAGALRAWGVRLWLSANYAAPMVLTADDTNPITVADPADPRVRDWWRRKIDEIYDLIPDFGGFLVKANSEGQPGPLDYGRTHAEGANMLADLLAPHGGRLNWRSFVHKGFPGWAEYEYRVFHPLDGDFHGNVSVQTKNGPIDFQVREPVNPMFGGMPNTNQTIELEITQEYTGQATHLCYLVTQWKTVLDFATYASNDGKSPTVADIVTGNAYDQTDVGFAGVANIGEDRNWTGYQLGAANTHGFARLAWNPSLSAEEIVHEWIELTFGTDPAISQLLAPLMLKSWTTYEDYTSPLGMGYLTYPLGAHFAPDPQSTLNLSHDTNTAGTGLDRTAATGSGFTGLYSQHWADIYGSAERCPDALLLFMHWVEYTHRLHSGKTVIQHIYDSHFDGYDHVLDFRRTWERLTGRVDDKRHAAILHTFDQQVLWARRWRDSIVSFFFSYARIPTDGEGWLQLDYPSAKLLLGGWPNRLDVDVTNATHRSASSTLQVGAIDDTWKSSAASVDIASTETVRVSLPVTPPLIADQQELTMETPSPLTSLNAKNQLFVVTPAPARCHLALDAGTTKSPLVTGYARLDPNTAWDPSTGYGWLGPKPQDRDRGGGWDALRRDFCGDYQARTLRISLPAGTQHVSALVGDAGPDAAPTAIAEGGSLLATSPDLAGGNFAWVHFDLDGGTSGRTADLTFSSLRNKFWHLCALVIPDLDSTIPAAIVTDVSTDPVWVGEGQQVAVSVLNTTDAELKVVITVDSPAEWSSQPITATLQAGRERTISVPVSAPSVPAIGTLAVSITGSVRVHDGEHRLSVISVPAGDQVQLTLDAGGDESPVADGFTRLAPHTTSSATAEFGWVGTVPDFRDRARMDDLRRDIIIGRDAEYVLRIAVPAGKHRLSVLTGDAYSPSGTTSVYEGSTLLGSSGNSIIAQGDFRWFSFLLDGGTPGRTVDLRVVGSQRDGYWRIAGLVMQDAI